MPARFSKGAQAPVVDNFSATALPPDSGKPAFDPASAMSGALKAALGADALKRHLMAGQPDSAGKPVKRTKDDSRQKTARPGTAAKPTLGPRQGHR